MHGGWLFGLSITSGDDAAQSLGLYMSSSFKVKFPICPITCLLGKRPGNSPGVTVDRLWTLGCLTIKRLVLMNWKVRKPGCFTRDSWRGEFLDLLNMERAACLTLIKVWKTTRTMSTAF